MMNEETLSQLRELRLKPLADAIEYQLKCVQYQDMSFDERCAILVQNLYDTRMQTRFQNNLKDARLKFSDARLEYFDYSHPRGVEKSLLADLATCNWVRAKRNILITGATGTGKTWLSSALAAEAIRLGYKVRQGRISEILSSVSHVTNSKGCKSERKKLNNKSILILDDFGLKPMNQDQLSDLLDLVDDRIEKGSLIITSQIPVDKWYEYLDEETVGEAFLDRLVYQSYRIELKGASMRKVLADKERKKA